MKTNASTGWIGFKFYMDETSVYKACCADVLGYNRRQLERWKDDIRREAA
jgi:hypothetical protein